MKLKLTRGGVLGVVVGLAVGVGGYTFDYAKGGSYFYDDPKACANCHIMDEHYSAWIKSSHHAGATCNDCHTPANMAGKYLSKAENGFWHSLKFTTGNFHYPLQIRAHNRRITENACRKCHGDIVHAIEAPSGAEQLSCIPCHRGVGHPKY